MEKGEFVNTGTVPYDLAFDSLARTLRESTKHITVAFGKTNAKRSRNSRAAITD